MTGGANGIGRATALALANAGARVWVWDLDAAAGVGAVIKTALAIEHGEIPPSVHFEEPNPEIGFAGSPVYVPTTCRAWNSGAGRSRRAGVSSFGIGGA